MGSAAIRPSARLAELLRRRRQELGLTLQQVSDHTAARGERLPASTLARIEQGKLDPGVCRLQVLIELYDVAPAELSHRVGLDFRGLAPPPARDRATLYDRAVELWKAGDAEQALNHLLAVRDLADAAQDVHLRQRAVLTTAVIARNMNRLRMAKQLVDELLCEPPREKATLVKALVLSTSLWRALGSMTMARATIEHARTLLRPGESELFALVLHQAAKLAFEDERFGDAEDLLAHALRHYRRRKDGHGEVRANVLLARTLDRTGRMKDALRVIRRALNTARKRRQKRQELYCRVELGRLLVASGSPDAGLSELQSGLALAVKLDDANGRFHAHYELWRAWTSAGDEQRATVELQSARYFAQFAEDDSAEVRAVRETDGPGPTRRRGAKRG